MRKRIICTLLVLYLALSVIPAIAAGDVIELIVDSPQAFVGGVGVQIDPDNSNVTPIIRDDRTLLPVRFIAENLGMEVAWNGANRMVSLAGEGATIDLTIDSFLSSVNGAIVTLDVAPIIFEERTYLPIRFISEALDKKVDWDGSTRKVTISSERAVPDEPWVELVEFKPSEGDVTYEFKSAEFVDKIDGSLVLQNMSLAVQKMLGKGVAKEPKHSTVSEAMKKLISGEKDIIFVPYPSDEEFKKAKDAGVQLEGAAIAVDALVFLKHPKNPAKSLTSEQIRGIYSEKEIKWDALCADYPEKGFSKTINAYQLNAHLDAKTDMLRFMGDVPLTKEEQEQSLVWETTKSGSTEYKRQVSNGLYKHTNGIGYSYYYLIENKYSLKDEWYSYGDYLEIDNFEPAELTIREGVYPIVVKYYAIIRADSAAGSFERELLEYMLLREGQKVIKEAGYITL